MEFCSKGSDEMVLLLHLDDVRAIKEGLYLPVPRRTDTKSTIEALRALAQITRLSAFRHLIAAMPEGLSASKIARLCNVPHNTMSTHLAILSRSGLIECERRGRVMNYRVDLDGFRTMIRFLTQDCCKGRPEICAPLLADLAIGRRPTKVSSHV